MKICNYSLYGYFDSKRDVDTDEDIGNDFIVIVKKITKVFCKATVEILIKEYPRTSYLLFNIYPNIPGKRSNIYVSYN